MTALTRYQRLEAEGVWRRSPEARRRDVVVVLGDATLVIMDRGEQALAHWSLPAIERRRAGPPAVYAPGPDAAEELEVADDEMVAAIETVRAAIARRRARPGSLRAVLLGAVLLAVIAAAAFWLPDAVIRHTARVLPPATRADIGDRLLEHVTRLTGPPCARSTANAALARLDSRLRGDEAAELIVVPGGATEAQHLPGGAIILRRTLFEDHDEPAVVAGFILAEAASAAATDPTLRLLSDAGPVAAFRLLTTGRIADDILAAHAERLITGPPDAPPGDLLIAAFRDVAVPAAPYAFARDVTGETILWLIEADPVPVAKARPVLSDGDWVSLQGVCGG